MWVLKLGGSLAHASELRAWLAACCDPGIPIGVVVPGGGPFADAVREAQRETGFVDRIAHRMALLAMAQYGWMLHALEPRLVPASGLAAVRTELRAGRRVLWLPQADEACNAVLPQSWDLTSDSLALWLAAEIGAAGVALVKSVVPRGEARDAATLAAEGYVDRCFADLLRASALRACWFAREEAGALRELAAAPETSRLIV
ncbi:MAG: hypothetical protein HY749_21480 [Gammaproteobacteria bacterium]|nr:hypothetical protein [Gammaproteobacteria bacterium]MBI5618862.1 hypothetical protein [Gammaproteobacteria bacterium]